MSADELERCEAERDEARAERDALVAAVDATCGDLGPVPSPARTALISAAVAMRDAFRYRPEGQSGYESLLRKVRQVCAAVDALEAADAETSNYG